MTGSHGTRKRTGHGFSGKRIALFSPLKFVWFSLSSSFWKLVLVFLLCLFHHCWLQEFAIASCSTQVLSSLISLTILPDSFIASDQLLWHTTPFSPTLHIYPRHQEHFFYSLSWARKREHAASHCQTLEPGPGGSWCGVPHPEPYRICCLDSL